MPRKLGWDGLACSDFGGIINYSTVNFEGADGARVLYEQQLDMSESILGCHDVLHTEASPHRLRGGRVNIPHLECVFCVAT